MAVKFKVKDRVEMLTMQKHGDFAGKYGLTIRARPGD